MFWEILKFGFQIFDWNYQFHINFLNFNLTLSHPGKAFTRADGKTTDYAPTLGQLAVAAAMRKLNMGKADAVDAASMSSQANFHGEFVVNVGDNFYPQGVTEADAKQRFHNIVEAVYGKKSSVPADRNVVTSMKHGHIELPPVLYTIAGNNDYYLEETQQKDMLARKEFTEHFAAGRDKVNVQIGYTEKVDIW
jgi:hypothetical protein